MGHDPSPAAFGAAARQDGCRDDAVRRIPVTALGPGANLFPGPPPTRLPSDPRPVAELTAGDDPAAVAAAYPASSFGWAALAQRAAAAGSWIESYAYARVGYHRGLDSLRRAGWKGTGPVPWSHQPNRGFLVCVSALGCRSRRHRRDPRGRPLPGAAVRLRPDDRPGRRAHPRLTGGRATRPGPPAVTNNRPKNRYSLTTCQHSCSSAPNGATRAKEKRPTCSVGGSTTSSATRAATTPATRWSSARSRTRST